MPPTEPSRKQPTTNRKMLWVIVPAVLLLAAAMAYLWSNPATVPVGPTATVPASVEPDSAPDTPAPTAVAPAPVARHIYSETANPKVDIAAALGQAKSEHKRVLIDFGGDWCPDCQVLDIYFHQDPNAKLLADHFVLVHVWIGQMDAHLDVAAKYGITITKGVPALAVLSPNGSVLYGQSTSEFRDMRNMESSSVTEFLNQWKS